LPASNGLSWDNVNLTLGEASTTQTPSRLKPYKQPTKLFVGPPKRKNGIRVVPLFAVLVDELRLLETTQQRHREAFGEALDGPAIQ